MTNNNSIPYFWYRDKTYNYKTYIRYITINVKNKTFKHDEIVDRITLNYEGEIINYDKESTQKIDN